MPKKTKKQSKCVNNALVEHLQGLQRKAKHTRAQKLSFTYSKAIKSLKKYPIEIKSGKEARVLEGIGPFIGKKIDAYFNIDPDGSSSDSQSSVSSENDELQVTNYNSSSSSSRNYRNTTSSSNRANFNSRTKNSNKSSINSRTSSKQYMPRYQSAAWAILVAMYKMAKENGDKYASWTKQEIIDEAQPLTETSFYSQSTANGYRSGWSCMKNTLVKKRFVLYRGHPSMFRLTREGFQLAKKLYIGERRMQGEEVSDDEFSSSCSSEEDSDESIDSEERPRETSSQRSNEYVENENRKRKKKSKPTQRGIDIPPNVNTTITISGSEDEKSVDCMEIDTLTGSQTLNNENSSHFNDSQEYTEPQETPSFLFSATDSPLNFKDFAKKSTRRKDKQIDGYENSDEESLNNYGDNNNNGNFEYQVILALDQRERTRGSREYIFDHLTKTNITVEKHSLDIGDMIWIARHIQTGQEIVLNYIVERKAADDLASSIIDGRYMEQKYRLKQSGITNIFYLVEGDLSSQRRLPVESLRSALIRTQISEGFFVKQTQNVDHSIEYLSVLTNIIDTQIRQHGLESALPREPGIIENGNNNEPEVDSADVVVISENDTEESKSKMTLNQFNKALRKNGDLTLREIFGRQLASIYGCSADKAIAIMEKYPTPSSLIEAYDVCGTLKQRKELLKNIQIANEMSNRPKIGTSLSSFIDLLYNTSDKYT